MNNLDTKKIIALMQDKKVQDYTFLIVFFIIFSFFVIFAIRPNVMTAFNLQKELQQIKLQNREFEEEIMQIVSYQSTLENYRSDMGLLDDAIPSTPHIAKVVEDIRQSATDSGVLLKSLNVESVEYNSKKNQKTLSTFTVAVDIETEYSKLQTFLDMLMANRRLKTLEKVDITKQSNVAAEEEVTQKNLYTIVITIGNSYL